jgi:hypothetical protein
MKEIPMRWWMSEEQHRTDYALEKLIEFTEKADAVYNDEAPINRGVVKLSEISGKVVIWNKLLRGG